MNILIADDHVIVRRGLQQIIAIRPRWFVGAEVSSAHEVLPALRSGTFDVLILDVELGDRSGIGLLGPIRAEFPSLPVLMLSMHAEDQFAIRALRAGATGYIQKDRSPEEILKAIERVASGRRYVSDAVSEQLVDEIVGGRERELHERLSAREFEVLRLLAAGKSPTEIGGIMNLSVKTVSTYRTRILQKMGFRSNAEIIAYAIRMHLV